MLTSCLACGIIIRNKYLIRRDLAMEGYYTIGEMNKLSIDRIYLACIEKNPENSKHYDSTSFTAVYETDDGQYVDLVENNVVDEENNVVKFKDPIKNYWKKISFRILAGKIYMLTPNDWLYERYFDKVRTMKKQLGN